MKILINVSTVFSIGLGSAVLPRHTVFLLKGVVRKLTQLNTLLSWRVISDIFVSSVVLKPPQKSHNVMFYYVLCSYILLFYQTGSSEEQHFLSCVLYRIVIQEVNYLNSES